jgi:hypothetical protein
MTASILFLETSGAPLTIPGCGTPSTAPPAVHGDRGARLDAGNVPEKTSVVPLKSMIVLGPAGLNKPGPACRSRCPRLASAVRRLQALRRRPAPPSRPSTAFGARAAVTDLLLAAWSSMDRVDETAGAARIPSLFCAHRTSARRSAVPWLVLLPWPRDGAAPGGLRARARGQELPAGRSGR